MYFVPAAPVVTLYISCKQIMYFILIYLTEHFIPKVQFWSKSENVVIEKTSVCRTEWEKKCKEETKASVYVYQIKRRLVNCEDRLIGHKSGTVL